MAEEQNHEQRRATDPLLASLNENIARLTETSLKHERQLAANDYEIRLHGREIQALQDEQRTVRDRIESHWAGVQEAQTQINQILLDTLKKHQLMALTSLIIFFAIVLYHFLVVR